MASLYDEIVTFFREDAWDVVALEDQHLLRMRALGEHGRWVCYAQALEDTEQFVFYSVCGKNTPAERRAAMAEFLTRANFGLTIGNFELDMDDGQVRFKTSIDVEGDRLSQALIRRVVYANLAAMDRYLPGVMQMIDENTLPVDAIRMVEADEP